MRLSKICIVVVGIGVPLGTPMLFAQDPAGNAIIRKVNDHYNRLSSLRTAYTEHYSGMGMDRTEKGVLLLKKPGRMRWDYEKPAGKVFILDGKYGWFYTPGDTQATKIAAKKLDDLRSPLRFLLGHTQLKKELDRLTVVADGPVFQIAGVPKGMEQRVKMLTLAVDTNGTISRMRVDEIDGSMTEFTFSEMKENVPAQDSEFTFRAPEGVSVVDGLPPI